MNETKPDLGFPFEPDSTLMQLSSLRERARDLISARAS